jgi:ABC-type spermidine/putrescine transport system permease subunit II
MMTLKAKIRWAFRVVEVLVVAAAILGPLFYLLLLSLSQRWFFPDLLPGTLTIDHWLRLSGSSSPFLRSLIVSVLISATVAFLGTSLGFVTGRYIGYHRKREKILRLVYLPFALSPVILGTMLMNLYLRTGLAGSFTGVVLAQLTLAFGFTIIFFDGFWTRRMRAMEEDARSLGCNSRQRFRYVLIPVSADAVRICFFQTFLISWYQYGLTLLVGSGRIRTLPLLVYEYIGEANPYTAAVASLLLTIPPVIVLLASRRFAFRTTG